MTNMSESSGSAIGSSDEETSQSMSDVDSLSSRDWDTLLTKNHPFVDHFYKSLKIISKKCCDSRMRREMLYHVIQQYDLTKLSGKINDFFDIPIKNREEFHDVSSNIKKLKMNKFHLPLYWTNFLKQKDLQNSIGSLHGTSDNFMQQCIKYRNEIDFYSPENLILTISRDAQEDRNDMSKYWLSMIEEFSAKRGSNEFYSNEQYLERLRQHVLMIIQERAFQIIHNSLHFFMGTFQDQDTMPLLYLSAHYHRGKFFFNPSLDTVETYFNGFMKQMTNLNHRWWTLGRKTFNWKKPFKFNSFLKHYLRLNQVTFGKILSAAYVPLIDHYKSKEIKYALISRPYMRQSKKKIFLNREKALNKLFRKYYYWDRWRNTVMELSDQEFVHLFCIDQALAKKGMLKAVRLRTDDTVCDLMLEHIQLVWQIRGSILFVIRKCKTEPKSAEELIAAGEFMTFAGSIWLERITRSVQLSISFGVKLMDIVIFKRDHLRLMCDNFAMLHSLKRHFKEFNEMFEESRYQMEESLQTITEELNRDLEDFGNKFLEGLNYLDKRSLMPKYKHYMLNFIRVISEFEDRVSFINKEETLLRLPLSTYPELDEIKMIVYPLAKLVMVVNQWLRTYNHYMTGPFEPETFHGIEDTVDKNHEQISAMCHNFKQRIKQHVIDNYPKRFKGNVDDPDFNLWPSPLKITHFGLETLKHIKQQFTLINMIASPHLQDRHWKEMSDLVGFNIKPNAGTTLKDFIDYHIEEHFDKMEIIFIAATKEASVLKSFREMQSEWETIEFNFATIKGHEVLGSSETIRTILDDHGIKTVSLMGSAFAGSIKHEITHWYQQLSQINKLLDKCEKVQTFWLSMLAVFTVQDISDQMLNGSALMKELAVKYRSVLSNMETCPNLISLDANQLISVLDYCIERTELISKDVSLYLDKVMLAFPRFFFLSTEELLSTVSMTLNPSEIESRVKKCFEGISKLIITDNVNIQGIQSSSGHTLKFSDKIVATVYVERWFLQIEREIQIALRRDILTLIETLGKTPQEQLIYQWPQTIQCVSRIYWTKNVHLSLTRNVLEKYLKGLENRIKSQILSIRAVDPDNYRISSQFILLQDVQSRDTVQELIKNKVTSVDHFLWLVQMRYYYKTDVTVVILNSLFNYGYECLPLGRLFVATPLTDRCFSSILAAYQLHLTGHLEGPGGTGKTETIKNLCSTLGVRCFIFSCSVVLNGELIGKLIKGIAPTGCWLCLDNFNLMDVESMSVAAQRIFLLIQAARRKLKTFDFEGTRIEYNIRCNVCFTATRERGRIQPNIPENLKSLYRSVAVTLPQTERIAELYLIIHGFTQTSSMAKKLVTFYRLCSDKFDFSYDFGISAVLSTIRALPKIKSSGDVDECLVKAIVLTEVPKYSEKDLSTLKDIISSVFPLVTIPMNDDTKRLGIIEKHCLRKNLHPNEMFIVKIKQMYDTLAIKRGLMITGESSSGKSSGLKILSSTFEQISKASVICYAISPNSWSLINLFGYADSNSWVDGIVNTILREFNGSDMTSKKWIVFDGEIHSEWAENLFPLLDDSIIIHQFSTETITIPSGLSIVFETDDLTQASPALILRCGIVYFDCVKSGWTALVKAWSKTLPKQWTDDSSAIESLFDWLVPPSLEFIERHCTRTVNGGIHNAVQTTIKLFTALLTTGFEQETTVYLQQWRLGCMVEAVVWGLAGTLDSQSRDKFDQFFKQLVKGQIDEFPLPPSVRLNDVNLIPTDGNLHDYSFVCKGKGAWKYFPDVCKSMKLLDDQNINDIIIPTFDTLKYFNIMEVHAKRRMPFIINGPPVSGKTTYFQHLLLNKLNLDSHVPTILPFNSNTTANETQEFLMSKLIKKKKNLYGAPPGKISVIFLEDLNVSGASSTLELVRHYLNYGYWYDLKTSSKSIIDDLYFIGAMGQEKSNQRTTTRRFLRHFSLFSLNPFSEETIARIFCTILTSNLKHNGFPTDALSIVQVIVSATYKLYVQIHAKCLPSPSKPYYIFSVRDMERVFSGISLIKKESADSKKVFVRLWSHEIMRVFYDKITDRTNRHVLIQSIVTLISQVFKESPAEVFDCSDDSETNLEDSLTNLLFTNALDTESVEDKKYEETNFEQFHSFTVNFLNEYNVTHKENITLILFRDLLEHISRLCRILSMPKSSGLLIGISGSGRRSIIKLAGALKSIEIIWAEGSLKSTDCWRNHLKQVLKETGGNNRELIFAVDEHHLKNEICLDDLSFLLKLGQVNNLYTARESQEIVDMVRHDAQRGNRNLDINPLLVLNHFYNRSRKNLHILLYASFSSGIGFRSGRFGTILSCCTVDWFNNWPNEGMKMVALHFIENIELEEELKTKIVSVFTEFYHIGRGISNKFEKSTGRKIFITSASFLTFIRTFIRTYKQKLQVLSDTKIRYENGLDKLAHAENQVKQMQKDLEVLQPKLKDAMEEAELMLKNVEKEKATVDIASHQVKTDETVANKQAEKAIALKTDCESELAVAIPILEDAIEALNTLKPTDITLVKSMKNPPDTVKLVIAAVCVMKDVKPDRIPDPANPGKKILDYWGPSKRVLGDMAFLQTLKDYDKDNIAPHIMQTIRKVYIPNKDFVPNVVAKASSAAEGLCKWVLAMDKYDTVVKMVAPKKEKLLVAENEYARTMKLLEEKRTELRALQDKLESLNITLEVALKQKENFEDEVSRCSMKLNKAETVIESLVGEKKIWNQISAQTAKRFERLLGDILVSSAILVYLGSFPQLFRDETIATWIEACRKHEIDISDDYNFSNIMSNEIQIQEWILHKLPPDAFSIQNAIINDFVGRWPLFIDPHGQANEWIQNMIQPRNGKVTSPGHSDFEAIVLYCIEFGHDVLVENVDEDVCISLYPLLKKYTYLSKDESIKLFGKEVRIHEQFRLYITTKLPNPSLCPEIFNSMVVIDFAFTSDGLYKQLLDIIVSLERQEVAEQSKNLTAMSARNKKLLLEAEDEVLELLSSNKNIVEDDDAVQTLKLSKVKSGQILKEQENIEHAQTEIEMYRKLYYSVAEFSSNLYYTTTNLHFINIMYQFSLTWFINIYVKSINSTKHNYKDDKIRLADLRSTFVHNLFTDVCRSLFGPHKMLYTFILCLNVMIFEKKLTKIQVEFLMNDNELDMTDQERPLWLSKRAWGQLIETDHFEGLEGILYHFKNNTEQWKQLYDSLNPQLHDIPECLNVKLTDFQKLVIMKIFRPDKIYSSIVSVIAGELGEEYTHFPGFSIKESYKDSRYDLPLLFIMSLGSDPIHELTLFAESTGNSLVTISLEKNDHTTMGAVHKAQNEGLWICLQNCHLQTNCLADLEKLCLQLSASNTKDKFRMWLTSSPSSKIPSSILQLSIKMAVEKSTGLRGSLWEAYNSSPINDEKFYNSCGQNQNTFARLLFGFSFFHAVAKERCQFGSTGWSIPYEFTDDSDYFISVQQLRMAVQEFNSHLLTSLHYIIADCNYGGKVSDPWDRRILDVLFDKYVNKEIVSSSGFRLHDGDDRYTLPLPYGHDDFSQFIKGLPYFPPAELLGLNINSGLIRDTEVSSGFLKSLRRVLDVTYCNNDSVYETAQKSISHIRENLGTPVINIAPTTDTWLTFANDESRKFNQLLETISGSLDDLQDAIHGGTQITPRLDYLAFCLARRRIPDEWLRMSYPSSKSLGQFIGDLTARVNYLKEWRTALVEEFKFNFSSLFSPKAFFATLLQINSRTKQIPIEQLTLDFEVLKEINNAQGTQIYGLVLEACRWDHERHCLEEQQPKIRYAQLPALLIKPELKKESMEDNRYVCPLYRTIARTHFVRPILLQTNRPSEYWILRGAALMGEVNETDYQTLQ